MKRIYHIPTEQFGFIEAELLETEELTPEGIKTLINDYRGISEAVKTAPEEPVGLTAKENNFVYDKYLNTGTFDPEMQDLYFKMNDKQKGEIQALKRAFTRADNKNK